jgi:hypothetical protein
MKASYRILLQRVLLALCLTAIIGCSGLGSGPSLPGRKKMPDLTFDDDNFEGVPAFQNRPTNFLPAYGFNVQETELSINGTTQGFVSIALPDPSTDEATVNLLEGLKPFALTLLSGWAQQQRNGVAIDLSAHNGEIIHRSDYKLEQSNGFSIPLVLIWDRNSESRVNTIKQLISEVPQLKLNSISAN